MFDKLIENFPIILRALTFKRTLQVIILSIVFTMLYAAWDSRQAIVDAMKVVALGKQTKNLIVADEATTKAVRILVDRSVLITALQIVNVNFPSNTRTTVYFYSDRSDLQRAIDSSILNRVSPAPLFMTAPPGGTPEQAAFAQLNNTRVIEISQADFVCYDTSTTLLARMAPEVSPTAPVVCSISIPPYAGKFSGYLNLLLTRQPNADEKATLRDAARALASDIFDRELAR